SLHIAYIEQRKFMLLFDGFFPLIPRRKTQGIEAVCRATVQKLITGLDIGAGYIASGRLPVKGSDQAGEIQGQFCTIAPERGIEADIAPGLGLKPTIYG